MVLNTCVHYRNDINYKLTLTDSKAIILNNTIKPPQLIKKAMQKE